MRFFTILRKKENAMKRSIRPLAALAALLLSASCQDFFGQGEPGTLIISLPELLPPATRTANGIPDTGDFIITVTGPDGNTVYNDCYARLSDELSVPAGAYTVSAISGVFEVPAFDSPQWGDMQVVTVPQGGSVTVDLSCSQLNSGIRLEVDDSFRNAFRTGELTLKSAEGSLQYDYDEPRAAFFRPGTVSLLLHDGEYVQTLFSRTLEARQILTVRLSAAVGTRSGGITVALDTVRTWLSDSVVIGGGGADSPEGAYDVMQARQHPDEKGVWVQGYIVGVATSSKKIAFEGPFDKNTNLVLGNRAATADPDYCLAVELPAGPVREALNLKDHPGLLGRKVYIKGNLVSAYYGIPGLKSPSEYEF